MSALLEDDLLRLLTLPWALLPPPTVALLPGAPAPALELLLCGGIGDGAASRSGVLFSYRFLGTSVNRQNSSYNVDFVYDSLLYLVVRHGMHPKPHFHQLASVTGFPCFTYCPKLKLLRKCGMRVKNFESFFFFKYSIDTCRTTGISFG